MSETDTLTVQHVDQKGTVLVLVTQSCLTLCDPMDYSSSWSSAGKNTGVGSNCLLQGIFPAQGSNPGLPHCRQILFCVSHQESPDKKGLWTQTLTLPSCIQGTIAFLRTVRPSSPSLAVQCIAETDWQPGPLLQCLHLDKCLFRPQNTKTLERTKNNCVHVQLGQTMDNKIQKDPKTTKRHF